MTGRKILLLVLLLVCSSCHEEQTIPVEIDVNLSIKEDNHTSPMFVFIENNTQNASNFLWTFEGGEPATSSLKNPDVVCFTDPGEHQIILEAWNEGNRTSQTYTVRVDSAVTLDFAMEVDVNNYAPATFKVINRTTGGSSYQWTSEGGEPAFYQGQNPPPVVYALEGRYTVSLTVENGSATFTDKREIEVRESLEASFSIIPSYEDEDDGEAPLRATFVTHLQGVETLRWECAGASINKASSVDADIYFPSEGQYTVYLEVSNGKDNKRISQDITVKANTNLRTHSNIRLGINTALAQYDAFYSTRLRRSFQPSEIDNNIVPFIDIAYFGLNANFIYNRFVSPDQLSDTSLPVIPNASHTWFINRTELGAITFTPKQFEDMTTDVLLRDLPIATAGYGDEFFPATPLPRVVLFETADGRKGSILVKEMVTNGVNHSYITIDIKVQKND